MRVSAAGNMPLQGLVKPPAKPVVMIDISKLGMNSKIKKFSYSFICGKGYFSPLRGEE